VDIRFSSPRIKWYGYKSRIYIITRILITIVAKRFWRPFVIWSIDIGGLFVLLLGPDRLAMHASNRDPKSQSSMSCTINCLVLYRQILEACICWHGAKDCSCREQTKNDGDISILHPRIHPKLLMSWGGDTVTLTLVCVLQGVAYFTLTKLDPFHRVVSNY